MRLKIICSLDHEEIPQDFRRKVLSLFKKSLSNTNHEFFQALFGTNKQKNYTWSTFFPQAVFKQECIIIPEKKFILNFSTGDAEIGLNFYNAFCRLKGKKVAFSTGNTLCIQTIQMVHASSIKQNLATFRILSPIIARNHNRETKKDWFYSINDLEMFQHVLKENLGYRLSAKYGEYVQNDIENLVFEPIQMKRTVVKHYDKFLESSIGLLKVNGKPYLLNEIRDNGLGSLCGSGFGMLEIV
ncbi:CRISPR-associated endoribonuclease Cas6 [Vagococcus entomophilus]|uniref:CRISPR-associated endoribonuclease Cas6 n=1 Tax=Vagococcus entomophilus TaxID=1160095 RepID=A0A430AKK0_9ENTE|nr:CRISPR-associated endoribonuclease Cas6 [Vagococcus entomophilus]RSU08642.1 CRISPR-associated endoribonuclease Cas6 [Vagococcus entomophilus]